MDLELRTGELRGFQVGVIVFHRLARPLQVRREVVRHFDPGDRRLFVDRYLEQPRLGIADLEPVLQRRQNLREGGQITVVLLVGQHRDGRFGLVCLANIQGRRQRLEARVFDLGDDLQARPDPDVGIPGTHLDDLDRPHGRDEREGAQQPARQRRPGRHQPVQKHDERQHTTEEQERLEQVTGRLHAEGKTPPATFLGGRADEGEVGHGRGGLRQGGLAERSRACPVCRGKLHDVDQVAFELRKSELHAAGGARQRSAAAFEAESLKQKRDQSQHGPRREQAGEGPLAKREEGVGQHKNRQDRQRGTGRHDHPAPERIRPPVAPGSPQPRGYCFRLGRHCICPLSFVLCWLSVSGVGDPSINGRRHRPRAGREAHRTRDKGPGTKDKKLNA